MGAVGTISGAASSGVGIWASHSNLLANNVNSPLLRSAILTPLASGTGHIVGGTTWNLFDGQDFGDAFSNSFQGIGKSMTWGTATGVITTTTTSLAGGMNPFNGMPLRTSKIVTVLGSQGKYEPLARKIGANSFELPDEVWNALTPAQRMELNQTFLDQVIMRGDNIRFSNNPKASIPGTYFYWEVNYLRDHGYRYTPNKAWMIKY